MREILIRAGAVSIRAKLLNTPTADRIWEALPLRAEARAWGKEIYFDAEIAAEVEAGARHVVMLGEIAFWPEGGVVAIGFGPTPIAKRGEIRLAGACNVFAVAIDDVKELQDVHAGEQVTVLQVVPAIQAREIVRHSPGRAARPGA